MRIPVYHIDAFADRPFAGNPAAVCPLTSWLPDQTLQAIAAEHNLSETAFYVPRQGATGHYDLRWMTPQVEVDLCGHATLATAHVIMTIRRECTGGEVRFQSKSGALSVTKEDARYALNFPARPPQPFVPPAALAEALGAQPDEVLAAQDVFCLFRTEEEVRNLKPDFAKIAALDCFAVIVTAPGRDCDFVSRFFAPSKGINEDPVTGRAHCSLIPYWAKRLGKPSMFARQVSARGGELWCEDRGERVKIAGHAVKYSEGVIDLPS
jgi:PhzF family phenazine biosynthesis protein